VLFLLHANANRAACLSEVDFVSKNKLKTPFHVSSVPFAIATQRAASFTSGGILYGEKKERTSKLIPNKWYFTRFFLINLTILLHFVFLPFVEIIQS